MKKYLTNAYVLLYLAIIFWASAFVGIRIGLQSYTPTSLALFRYLVASIAVIPLYLKYFRTHKKLRTRDLLKILCIGILGFAIYNITLNYGEISTSASIASFIIGQTPAITILLAIIFLKERLNKMGWVGLAVSILGIFIIFLSKESGIHLDLGIIYVLIALIAGVLYSIFQKPLLKKVSGLEFAILAIWGGTASMVIFLPQMCREITTASLLSTTAVIYMGIFPGAISYLIWSKVLEKMDLSQASGCLYTMPIFTTIMGIFIGEFPQFLSLLGGIIALVGAIILHRSKNDKPVIPQLDR